MAYDDAVANARLTNGPSEVWVNGEETPITASGYQPQALANAPRTCRSCGTVSLQGHRCKECGRFLPANQTRRTTGVKARYQPAEILMSADQLLDAIGLLNLHF